jgi:hypothetical protein
MDYRLTSRIPSLVKQNVGSFRHIMKIGMGPKFLGMPSLYLFLQFGMNTWLRARRQGVVNAKN